VSFILASETSSGRMISSSGGATTWAPIAGFASAALRILSIAASGDRPGFNSTLVHRVEFGNVMTRPGAKASRLSAVSPLRRATAVKAETELQVVLFRDLWQEMI